MQRRDVLKRVALCGLAAAPAVRAQPAADDTWHDAARGWDIPVRLRWPAGDGPCAAVIHSHGLGGSRDGGDAWGEAWRQAGLLVVHVQHPGSDSAIWQGGMGAVRAAASAQQLLARVAHMRFVVDELQRRHAAGGTWGRVRLDRLGASGHSFGAQTVLAIAGRRYPPGVPDLAEPRLRAFIALSPALGRGDTRSAAEQVGSIARPFLAVTGSLDGDPLGTPMTGEDRARVYDGLPPGQRALLWLQDADHGTFSGNRSRPIVARTGPLKREDRAAELEPAHHARVARMTTLWWRWRLLDDIDAARQLQAAQGLGPGDRWQSD